MSRSSKKLLALLEERYGVRAEFAGHLVPVLERCIQQELSSQEWDELLAGLAAAYRACWDPEREATAEVRVLVAEFLSELRKIDESLKVVGVYLERIRQRLQPHAALRTLH